MAGLFIYSSQKFNSKAANNEIKRCIFFVCQQNVESWSSSYALATPPSIALHPLHNHQGSQLTIVNGVEVGEMLTDVASQQQRRKSIQAQHLLGASSDCEDNTMRLSPHNSELHLPDDTISTTIISDGRLLTACSHFNLNRICDFSLNFYLPTTGESSIYTLKLKRPSKGTVHFDCEEIDVIDQQKQQQMKVGDMSNDFDSKSIDWLLNQPLGPTQDESLLHIHEKETLTTSSWWMSTHESHSLNETKSRHITIPNCIIFTSC